MYSQNLPPMLAQRSQRLLNAALAIFRVTNRTSDARNTHRRARNERIEQHALLRLREPNGYRLILITEHLKGCSQRRPDDWNLARSEADFFVQANCRTRNVPLLVGHATVAELLPYRWVRFEGDDPPTKPRASELNAYSATAWVNIEDNRNPSALEDIGDNLELLLR